MNEQEFERKMAFIVDQQAQFASDIQALKETQVATANVVERLAYVMFEGFKYVNVKFDALVDSQLKLTESQRNLMSVVNQHLREDHNGK